MTFRRVCLLAAAAVTAGAFAIALPAEGVSAATPVVVYDSIPAVLAERPSYGFNTNTVRQFGDLVQLADGPRQLESVTVMMSSFFCESGPYNGPDPCVTTTPGGSTPVPATLNIYNPGPAGSNAIGSLVASVDQTIAMPFRPSAGTAQA